MNTQTQKTNKIIIIAKEWFDKVNVNSYFAAKIELENGTLFIPFTYGSIPFTYGYKYYYLYAAIQVLIKENYLPTTVHGSWTLENYCNENNIVLSYEIKRNCSKKELKHLVLN
jgi:hypothetical protein